MEGKEVIDTERLAETVAIRMFPNGNMPRVGRRMPRKLKKKMRNQAEVVLLMYCVSSRFTDDLEFTGDFRNYTLGGRHPGSKGFLRRIVAHLRYNMAVFLQE
jgi:hypothetical protein